MSRDVNDAGAHNGYATPMDPPDDNGQQGGDARGRTGASREDDAATEPIDAEAVRAKTVFDEQWKFISERVMPEGGDWLKSVPPPRGYLLTDAAGTGVLPSGKVGMLAGAGGAGKSFLLIQLAICVATGRAWAGTFPVPRPGPVVLALGEEDELEIRRRLYWAAYAMGLSEEEKDTVAANVLPMALCGKRVALTYSLDEVRFDRDRALELLERGTPFAGELLRHLKAAGREWRLIVVDPASRFGGSDVEIDNAAATRFIQKLEELTQVPGNPTVLVSHHTTKSSRTEKTDSTAARGASALTDGVRWQANLDSLTFPDAEKNAVLYRANLHVTKSNYAPFPPALMLARDSKYQGFLRPETESEKREREAAEKPPEKNSGGNRSSRRAKKKDGGGADYSPDDFATG